MRSRAHGNRRARGGSGGEGVHGRKSDRARWRKWVLLAALSVIGVTTYAGVRARHAWLAGYLPTVPSLDGQSRAVAEHIRNADRTARMSPTSATAVAALCLAYHADMFYGEADRCYEIVQRLSPSDWRWTYYRAMAQSERGKGDAVAEGMRHVVAAAPQFGPAWVRLGNAEFKSGRYDRAEEAWRRAMTAPDPPRIFDPRGRPEHPAGAPVSAEAALGVARVMLLRGDPDGARRVLETVTSESPRFGPAFRLLGEAYGALGRTAEAARAVQRADRLPATESYVDPMMVALVKESRQTTLLLQQAAKADLLVNAAWREYLVRRALELDPENPEITFELATVLRMLGRNHEALALLSRHQQLVPGDVQGLADMGRCLANLGRLSEAESYLQRALQGVDDANTHYDLGVVRAGLGQRADAIAEYRTALDRNPNHVNARNNLGAILVSSGRLREARLQLERVLEIDPANADARTNMGVLFAARGDYDQARREFREALRINPEQAQARDGMRAIEH